jgi:hypothetical protein
VPDMNVFVSRRMAHGAFDATLCLWRLPLRAIMATIMSHTNRTITPVG